MANMAPSAAPAETPSVNGLASGPVGEVLTRERVLDLYRVEADVSYHEAAGHVTVIPVRRAPAPPDAGGRP